MQSWNTENKVSLLDKVTAQKQCSLQFLEIIFLIIV